jgi:hypothetical protein
MIPVKREEMKRDNKEVQVHDGVDTAALQLDCPSCTAAQKINLPKFREGYEGSETTVGKLSRRRI